MKLLRLFGQIYRESLGEGFHEITPVADQVVQGCQNALLGLPIREGAVIRTTVIDGPSDRAGLESGDIVLSIGGRDVATVSDLTRLLKQEFSAGQEVEVEVFRTGDGAGERKTLTLELGERPRQ